MAIGSRWYASCSLHGKELRPDRRGHAFETSMASERNETMNILWALAVVFFVLWILGFAAFHVTSGLIHILLLLAVVAIVFRLVAGRRTV
jgi:Family of unknown function (DUF5670)